MYLRKGAYIRPIAPCEWLIGDQVVAKDTFDLFIIKERVCQQLPIQRQRGQLVLGTVGHNEINPLLCLLRQCCLIQLLSAQRMSLGH